MNRCLNTSNNKNTATSTYNVLYVYNQCFASYTASRTLFPGHVHWNKIGDCIITLLDILYLKCWINSVGYVWSGEFTTALVQWAPIEGTLFAEQFANGVQPLKWIGHKSVATPFYSNKVTFYSTPRARFASR